MNAFTAHARARGLVPTMRRMPKECERRQYFWAALINTFNRFLDWDHPSVAGAFYNYESHVKGCEGCQAYERRVDAELEKWAKERGAE